jgi:hypothetical protein
MTLDLAAMKAKLAQTKAGLKRAGTTIKPKPGKNDYVVLPPWTMEGDYAGQWHHNFGTHFIRDEADQLQATYICVNRTHDKPCDVCNTMAEAQRTVGAANPQLAELIKKAYAAQQFLVCVLPLNGENPDTPQVLTLGRTAFEQLTSIVDDWMESVFDPTSPQIITIERTGTTAKDTRYMVSVAPKKHSFKKKVEPINLAEFVKQESEAAQKKAVLALRSVAGASGAPRLAAPSSPNVPSTVAEFDDVPDFKTVTPPTAPQNAAPEAAGTPSLTEDLDAMLASLDA